MESGAKTDRPQFVRLGSHRELSLSATTRTQPGAADAGGLVLLIAIVMLPAAGQAQTAGAPLTLEAKIPLGAISGRIDHLGVDPKQQRLFVAELGNDSLGVVDLAAGKVLRTITGLKEPQSVAYSASPTASMSQTPATARCGC